MKIRAFEILMKIFFSLLRLKNFYKKKIFVYTDSRGYNVVGKYRKIPLDSYILSLCWKYNTKFVVCPEKYTTIIDFLLYAKSLDISKYDVVIMHCGVVDFSPRPMSNILNVRESKVESNFFKSLFSSNDEYYKRPFDVIYKGEKTITLYSKSYLENNVIPELKKMENLIWINSNNFVSGWEGNFTKGRPKNINELVNDYDRIMGVNLKYFIDLKVWNDEEIKKYTIDNIHFTKMGFLKVFELLKEKIEQMK